MWTLLIKWSNTTDEIISLGFVLAKFNTLFQIVNCEILTSKAKQMKTDQEHTTCVWYVVKIGLKIAHQNIRIVWFKLTFYYKSQL